MSNTIELSTTCNHAEYHCERCDNYSYIEETDTCPDCGSNNFEKLRKLTECSCIEWNYKTAQEIWETWANNNPAPYGWYVCSGSRQGWQNRLALIPLKEDVDNILDEFSYENKWLVANGINLGITTSAPYKTTHPLHFPTLEDAQIIDMFHISRSHHSSTLNKEIDIKPADFEEAIWCIEQSEETSDSRVGEIRNLMETKYEIGMLDEEKVIEICENVSLDPVDYLQDPEKFGFHKKINTSPRGNETL